MVVARAEDRGFWGSFLSVDLCILRRLPDLGFLKFVAIALFDDRESVSHCFPLSTLVAAVVIEVRAAR